MIAGSALPQLFRSRWDREFESVFLQRRVWCELRGCLRRKNFERRHSRRCTPNAREAARALQKGGLSERLSNMTLGRTGYPDDLAKAVLFMASDLASYVSGTSLTVDGAQTLR
jgi:hypothetical protein